MWGAKASWTSTQVRFCGYTNLYFWCDWCEEPKLAEQNQGHIPGSEIHNGLKLNIVLENVLWSIFFCRKLQTTQVKLLIMNIPANLLIRKDTVIVNRQNAWTEMNIQKTFGHLQQLL